MSELALSEPATSISLKRKSQALPITPRVRDAIELMVTEGKPWDEAATAVGMHVRAMRTALAKPHVIKHMKERREVFREHVCAANIRRLAQIRDAAPNMPAVNAIRALEQMGNDAVNGIAQRSQAPGLVIQVVNVISAHTPSAPISAQVIDNVENEK